MLVLVIVVAEPHPNTSRLFYGEIIKESKEKYNMEMLFTDFLCYRGPTMGQYNSDCGDDEEAQHKWLGGMTEGAADNDVEVQYCMALAHQILMSAEFPAVTNARVNGDGGLDVQGLRMPALLAATVGLGWSKDNLRTADKCYVNGTFPNGTLKWPCGSINQREGTSGLFTMQQQQTILATLSLGPVGISDQLTLNLRTPGAAARAEITTNVSLALSTCAATGDLLQPSYPLTVLDRSMAGLIPDMVELWGTYTAVTTAPQQRGYESSSDSSTAAAANVWYIALAFQFKTKGKVRPTLLLLENDLAPMVDATSLSAVTDRSSTVGSYSAIPVGAFLGAGAKLAGEYVVWSGDFLKMAASVAAAPLADGDGNGNDDAPVPDACAAVAVSAWHGSANVTVEPQGTLMHLAPVIGGTIALLGEAGKVRINSERIFQPCV